MPVIETLGQSVDAVFCASQVAVAARPAPQVPMPFYAFHYPLMRWAAQPWLSRELVGVGGSHAIAMMTLCASAVLFVSLGLALVSSRVLEQPCLRLR